MSSYFGALQKELRPRRRRRGIRGKKTAELILNGDEEDQESSSIQQLAKRSIKNAIWEIFTFILCDKSRCQFTAVQYFVILQ